LIISRGNNKIGLHLKNFVNNMKGANNMENKCWYHVFLPTRCKKKGLYGNTKYPISREFPTIDKGIRLMRWCDEHKHDDDILLDIEEGKNG